MEERTEREDVHSDLGDVSIHQPSVNILADQLSMTLVVSVHTVDEERKRGFSVLARVRKKRDRYAHASHLSLLVLQTRLDEPNLCPSLKVDLDLLEVPYQPLPLLLERVDLCSEIALRLIEPTLLQSFL